MLKDTHVHVLTIECCVVMEGPADRYICMKW